MVVFFSLVELAQELSGGSGGGGLSVLRSLRLVSHSRIVSMGSTNFQTEHVDVRSCLLIILQYQPSPCSSLDCVLNNQSDFDLVLYQQHWKFPTHKKIIPLLVLNLAYMYMLLGCQLYV